MTDANSTVDHEARRMAQDAKHHAERALDRIDTNQAIIESALNKHELFETEMRTAMRDMTERHISSHQKLNEEIHRIETALRTTFSDGNGRVHSRINQLLFVALIGLAGLVINAIWDKVVM